MSRERAGRRRAQGHLANPARLLFPALRAAPDGGLDGALAAATEASERGVGGFILFGGAGADVFRLSAELRARSTDPILLASDLERGAGQQFRGCTSLPPAAALASLDDLEVVWRAGRLTAREARALGVDWVLAPVADLDVEPRNPIVSTRSFGSEAAAVARHVAAWTLGCIAGGALPCVKHFPGHGRTVADSHDGLPVVDAGVDVLAHDLVSFAAGLSAGVPSVMTAHVAFPALDQQGRPATRSPEVIGALLRGRLGFRGVVVSDALIMSGARAAGEEEVSVAVEALAAGVDALLYPEDSTALALGMERQLGRSLDEGKVRSALGRLRRMRARIPRGPHRGSGQGIGWGRAEDRTWAREVALRTVGELRPSLRSPPMPFEVVTVEDDADGPFPPPDRSVFIDRLSALGVASAEDAEEAGARSRVVAVYADVRGWKGRAGLSHGAVRRLEELVRSRPSLVVLFSHPRHVDQIPAGTPVLCAWGGEPLMQEAAARAVARLS